MASLLEEFKAACSSLVEINLETVDLAQQVLERCHTAILETGTFGHGLPVQDEVANRHCFACIIYIAKGIIEGSRGHDAQQKRSTASLSKVLSAFHVGLEEFLKELPTVIKRAEPNLGPLLAGNVPLARRLKLRELQTSFVYTTVLAKKSKDLFRSYFDLSITGQGATDKASPFYAAWLLFVTAKSKLLPAFPDLVASFNLLICVLNVAIMHIPAPHRNVDLNDHSLFPVRTETGGADTLQSLCLVNKANLTAVRALMHGMDNMLKAAAKSVPAADTATTQPSADMVTSCSHYPGFMSVSAVTAAVAEELNTEYQQACASSIDVDERPFLGRAAEAPPTPGPSAAPPSLNRCMVGSPQRTSSSGPPRMVYLSPVTKNRSVASLQTLSPSGRNPISIFGLAQTPGMPALMGGFPGTPVSDAMTAASWLHDMSLRHPQQPTPQLQRFFIACDYDMTDLVAARIEQMAQAVFPLVPASQHALQALQAAMNNERRQQGVKLYYNVLEAMLAAEESRTHRANFTSLLSSNSFHKCLAACAFELIVASYKMVTHAFPAVLEKLELYAFDMCKIIDSFVRYEPSTPRDLKRHLHSIEEKIIESLAWERGSSLYSLLVAACENQENQDGEADPMKEDESSKEASPANLEESSKSHPTTPSKRKTSPTVAQPSTSNKSHKGNSDSSPSRQDQASKPFAAQQAAEPDMVAADGAEADVATAEPAASVSGTLADKVPQRTAAGDDAMQTPKRATSTSALSVFMTPKGSGLPLSGYGPAASTALPNGFCSMDTTGSYSDKPGRHILQEFLRKVLKLAANRSHDLCGRLDLENGNREEIETQVYHLIQHIVFKQTSLLYNRHLDQVLLSAVYGVCKVAQLKQISFKQIINHYRRQPQAKSDIFRTVVLKQTEVELQVLHTGDVIAFYNTVFVPAVKTDLLRINQDRASLARPPVTESLLGASPGRSYNRPEFPPNGFSTPPAASRALHGLSQRASLQKVSATKKVFVSPLRQSSPKQAPAMTPRTRSLYAYMGESQQPYQSPSKDLDLINGRVSGRPPHAVASANSGSTGHSSMEASQSPSVANSGDLLRQSSTVSMEARNGSGALQVLRAAAARADKWKAANVDGHAGSAQADAGSDSQGTHDSSHAGVQKAQSDQLV
ncbi:TPA: hypothetical protein ACH3X1_006367 [Trebouxia sp. C0004]